MTIIRYSSFIATLFILRHATDVHGCDNHDHHHLGRHHHQNDSADNNVEVDGIYKTNQKQGNLRRLGIFDNISDLLSSNRPCKDGEPTFTVGNVTYACLSEFQQKGGVCATSAMSTEERAISDEHFLEWEYFKNNMGWLGGEEGDRTRRSLGGCLDCVNWDTTTITIPTYFHVIHSGDTGKKFTYKSNPAYIQNQIKALNVGFRGEVNTAFTPFASRAYPRYDVKDTQTKIQFCLMGTTATDNEIWYKAQDDNAMKTALKKGGQESLNVYANAANGYLGYAYYPSTEDFVLDGVVILNDSMPGGAATRYNEGDT